MVPISVSRQNNTFLWFGLMLLALGYFWFIFPQFPDRIATHFSFNGVADKWSDKQQFRSLCILLFTIANVVVGLLRWGLIRKIPDGILNLPRKAYWFSTPDLREEAYARLETSMAMTGMFVNFVFLTVLQQIVQTSLPTPPFVIQSHYLPYIPIFGAIWLLYKIFSLVWTKKT